MRSGDLLSAFTPSNMEPSTLEAIFVKREPVARRIQDSITAAATSRDIEHHLVVGPRGMGKTHLLSVIVHRLWADPLFIDRASIAWLREEEWGVTSIGELYEAILKRLASDDTPIRVIHEAATAAVEQLAHTPYEELVDQAEHLLTKVVGDHLLVVVLENLDMVFENIGTDDQHRLRAYLQNERNLVLLASAPSLTHPMVESIALRKGLFFGFIHIEDLEELTVDEARELLVRVTELTEGDEDAERLRTFLATDTATARLRTVRELVGGHPRVWVLLAECITTERLEELVDLLLSVLDDLTPYYQSQMAGLSPHQRKLVMAMSRIDGATTVKDLAAKTRLQERSVAKHLGDLTDLGYTRLATLPEGIQVKDKRTRHYELREPLLRHVLDVKESRGQPLALIVVFLRVWYDPDRLRTWATKPGPARPYVVAALDPDPVLARWNDVLDAVRVQGRVPGAELRAALRHTHDDRIVRANLRWLVSRVHHDLDASRWPAVAAVLTHTAVEAGATAPLAEAILDSLPPDRTERAWLEAWQDSLSSSAVDAPIANLVAALVAYRGGGDGAALLALPPELRVVAYEIEGIDDSATRLGG